MKNYQLLTNQYYRLTEQTYKLLDRDGTDFMNLGLWPAESIREAQGKIYSKIFSLIASQMQSSNPFPYHFVELGCGFGGGVEIFKNFFPQSSYEGINSSANQIAFCQTKYAGQQQIQFMNGFYESYIHSNSQKPTCVFGVESLLHCENRELVFEMIQKSGFKYIALADILLKDQESKACPLFHPALSFAADFNEYQNLFEKFGYELLIDLDATEDVFPPWAHALTHLTPPLSGVHKRVKQQFIDSYTTLANLGRNGKAKYVFLIAKRKQGHS